MKEIREILIQDIGDKIEIELFEKYSLYRRDETSGKPLYFAPHFTAKSDKMFGISYLSTVLGVLTFKRIEFEKIIDDLESFTDNEIQKNKWIEGIQLESNFTSAEKEQTFYFLDEPITFAKPLMKDYENSRGWIGKTVPKNRTVSFIDFLKHIPELMDN